VSHLSLVFTGHAPLNLRHGAIGGGSYWVGRVAASQLFGPCGPPLSLARPLLNPLNITYYTRAVLHSHYKILISAGIENAIVWVGTHYSIHMLPCWWVHGPCSRPVNTGVQFFFFPPSASWLALALLCCLTKLTVWPAHFSDASAAYAWCYT